MASKPFCVGTTGLSFLYFEIFLESVQATSWFCCRAKNEQVLKDLSADFLSKVSE